MYNFLSNKQGRYNLMKLFIEISGLYTHGSVSRIKSVMGESLYWVCLGISIVIKQYNLIIICADYTSNSGVI